MTKKIIVKKLESKNKPVVDIAFPAYPPGGKKKPAVVVPVNPLSYTVFRDTREQQGWTFAEGKFCNGTIPKALKTGDYTLLGYEDKICIERKKNVAEIAHNVVEKRFEKELERMESFQYSFIVCEFTVSDIMNWPPFYLKDKVKMSKYFILRRLNEIQIKYKVKFIFAGVHAKDVLSDLFKRIVEMEVENGKRTG